MAKSVKEKTVELRYEYIKLSKEMLSTEVISVRNRANRRLQEIREEFMSINESLVRWSLKNHGAPNNQSCLSKEDLLQEARLALLEAWDSWDPEKGALATWAPYVIRAALQKQGYASDFSLLSKNAYKYRGKFANSYNKLQEKSSGAITAEDIAKDAEIPISAAKALLNSKRPLSIDAPISDDSSTSPINIIVDISESNQPQQESIYTDLSDVLSMYTAQDAAIIIRAYGLDGAPAENSIRLTSMLLTTNKHASELLREFADRFKKATSTKSLDGVAQLEHARIYQDYPETTTRQCVGV